MAVWETKIKPGFCLGCGKDVPRVAYQHNPYRSPKPDCLPTWCRTAACQKAKEKFRKVTRDIIGY